MLPIARLTSVLVVIAALAGCADDQSNTMHNAFLPSGKKVAEQPQPAPMRWGERAGAEAWTEATMQALEQHGVTMISRIPDDVAAFCPAYGKQDEDGRRAFWAGLMSSLTKHESTWNPQAKGGGGQWLGLMQIAPATWRSYGCTGEILNGADNMACAVKIASRQVGRDNAIVGGKAGWRGIARDWAPMRSAAKRADIAGWTARQPYCAAEG